jgi:hypothetical protein
MNNREDMHLTTLFSISHYVSVLANEQFTAIGYSPNPANGGLAYQNVCLIAYASNNSLRGNWIFFGDVGFNAAKIVNRSSQPT